MRHAEPHVKTTKVNWTNQSGGDWATASNWSNNALPNSNDAVTINTTSLQTVTHSTGNDTVYSLTVGNDIFVLSGGSLDTLHGASFANGFVQNGGTFTGGSVSIKGGGTLTGGAAEGSTTLSVSGTVALANYTLGGAAEITNSKAINQTGGITIGDNTGVGAGISNGAGGTYSIAGDFGINSGAASASIDNAGVFAKIAGNGTSVVNVSIVNTGTISVLAGGDLQFNGPSSVIGGVLKGAGEVSFAGSGGNTLTLGTAAIGAIGLYSTATLNLAGSASVLNGALYDQSNGNDLLSLGSGTLTVNGAAVFEGNYGTAYVSGTGGLALNGATTVYGADFGGQLQITNAGDFSVTGGNVNLGDGSGFAVGLTNTSTGTLQFTVDNGIGNGNSTANFITNAGKLEKTGGGGTTSLGVVVNNQAGGSILAESGSIQIANSLNNAGTLGGAGQIDVTGSATLSSGTTLSVAQFGLYNTGYVSLGTSLTYSGIFSDNSNGSDTLNLNAATLTLTGAQDSITGAYGTAYVNGTGSLAASGSATLTLAGTDFGGSVAFTNNGAVNQTSTVTIGDGSGNAATITNAHGGIWTIGDGQAVNNGNSVAGTLANAGLFQKTGGSNTSTVNTAFVNQSNGTISVASGSIQIAGSLVNSGVIGGAAQLYVTGSATLSAGTTLSVGQFGIYGTGSVSLGTSLTYAGTFSDNSNGTDTLNLNANTLTLTGAQDSITGAYGNATIGGSGTLVSSASTTLTLGGVQFGGTTAFTNDGTVKQTYTVTIGDGSGSIATVTNAHGATWTIAGDETINNGAATASSFTNAGTVSVQAGTGQAILNTSFVNGGNGTVNIASGSLSDNYLLTNAGTISGNDLALNGNGQATLNAGSKITTTSFDVYSNAVLNLGATQTYAGTFNDDSNGTTTINLNANNLNLTGSANFIGAYGVAYIGGSGTVSVTGSSTLSAAEIGGSATMTNAGTLLASGSLQLGDGSSNAAAFVNAAAGIYDIVNDNGGIGHGSSMLSNFTNAGLFEKTGGTGTTVITAGFVNNGTITVTSGTLEFTAGSLVNNGSINGVMSTDQNGNIFITHH